MVFNGSEFFHRLAGRHRDQLHDGQHRCQLGVLEADKKVGHRVRLGPAAVNLRIQGPDILRARFDQPPLHQLGADGGKDFSLIKVQTGGLFICFGSRGRFLVARQPVGQGPAQSRVFGEHLQQADEFPGRCGLERSINATLVINAVLPMDASFSHLSPRASRRQIGMYQ